MILGKFEKKYCLVLTMLLGLIIQGCNSEHDEFVDETNTSTINSGATAYDAVLRSREFKAYDSKYSDFMSIISEVMSRTSEEKKQELLKLSKLYVSDTQRYESLFRFEVANVFGNDSIRAKEALSSLLEAKENLTGNKRLSMEIKGNEKLIFAELQMNRDANSMFMNNKAPMLKTRSEDQDRIKCKDLCKEVYDNTTDDIDAAFICETAVNIALCIGSLGVDSPAALIIQLGLTGALHYQRDAALRDYNLCVRNCG